MRVYAVSRRICLVSAAGGLASCLFSVESWVSRGGILVLLSCHASRMKGARDAKTGQACGFERLAFKTFHLS